MTLGKGSLYAAFVDLRSAFDLVPRSRLWVTLRELGLSDNILTFVMRLHVSNHARIRWGGQGRVTTKFWLNEGYGKAVPWHQRYSLCILME